MRVRELIEQLQQIDDNGGGDMWVEILDYDQAVAANSVHVRDSHDLVYVIA